MSYVEKANLKGRPFSSKESKKCPETKETERSPLLKSGSD